MSRYFIVKNETNSTATALGARAVGNIEGRRKKRVDDSRWRVRMEPGFGEAENVDFVIVNGNDITHHQCKKV